MKSELNFYDSNFNKIELDELEVYGYNFSVPSPSYAIESVRLDSGETIVVNKLLNTRELEAEFLTNSADFKDSLEQKTLLFKLLGNGQSFYVEEIQRPNIVWKCELGDWLPEHITPSVTRFAIPFTCTSGVSQTINLVKQKFIESSFIFKNEGDLAIDPREAKYAETEITFNGPSTNLHITNKTTGETWSFNGSTTAEDEISLKGVRALKNEVSIFKNSNKTILSFLVGNNEIEISGASGEFELTISTRFYFL